MRNLAFKRLLLALHYPDFTLEQNLVPRLLINACQLTHQSSEGHRMGMCSHISFSSVGSDHVRTTWCENKKHPEINKREFPSYREGRLGAVSKKDLNGSYVLDKGSVASYWHWLCCDPGRGWWSTMALGTMPTAAVTSCPCRAEASSACASSSYTTLKDAPALGKKKPFAFGFCYFEEFFIGEKHNRMRGDNIIDMMI